MKKHIICKATALGLLAFSTFSVAKAQAETLYFGIVPQQAASKLVRIWVPFMKELSERSGLDIKFSTMKDIPTFEKCLAQGAYDIAYMNPYHYTVFSKQSGYRAIAHQSEKKLKGLIVVHKDSPIKSLKDLDKQKIAFPSPAAFGASVIPRAEMKKQGLNIKPVYVKSHDSVFKSVASRVFVAGGGVQRTYGAVQPSVAEDLRIIYKTNGYTPHAFAVNATMTEARKSKITELMQQIAQEKPDLVKKLGMKGFDAADDSAWDDVRGLNLTYEQTEVAQSGAVKCRFN